MALFGSGISQLVGVAGSLYLENAKLVENYGSVGAAIKAVLTPTTLFAGSLVGTVAAGIAMAKWATDSTVALSNLANQTGTTLTEMQGLEKLGSIKGLNTEEFEKGMSQFGSLTQQAANNMGQLNTLFLSNGKSASTLAQNVGTFANLMASATSDAQRYAILTEEGLPASAQWVAVWKQGGDAIKQATDEAAKFGTTADQSMVGKARAAQERWNGFWESFFSGAKRATLALADLATSSPTMTVQELNAQRDRHVAKPMGQSYGPFEMAGPPEP